MGDAAAFFDASAFGGAFWSAPPKNLDFLPSASFDPWLLLSGVGCGDGVALAFCRLAASEESSSASPHRPAHSCVLRARRPSLRQHRQQASSHQRTSGCPCLVPRAPSAWGPRGARLTTCRPLSHFKIIVHSTSIRGLLDKSSTNSRVLEFVPSAPGGNWGTDSTDECHRRLRPHH